MTRPRLILLLLILLTLVVYLPVLKCDFVNFDDPTYVTENSHVQPGLTWSGVKWAFTTWYGSNWHPLTWLSHMTDCELFGLNPAAHHAVNVLFHVLNVVVVFFLAQHWVKSVWVSAFVAALFAWHPLHVESVAWVSERKDVLSSFFALLALHAYTRHVQDKSRPAYWYALGFFALGLLAKPMLVTLPCVFLLLDWWPLSRWSIPGATSFTTPFSLLWEKWPFFLLSTACCVVTYLAQQAGESVLSVHQISVSLRVEEAVIAYGLYLYKTIWPVNLAIFYPLPQQIDWIHLSLAASSLAILSLSAFAWYRHRTAPYLLFGWAWFLGMLVPVIGLVKVGTALLADRYSYLPSLGLSLALAVGFRDLIIRFPALVRPVIAAAILSLVGCIAVTEHQLQFWRDSEALFKHASEVTVSNATAEIDYAAALEMRGALTNALSHYQQAALMAPTNPDAPNDLGNLLLKLGQPADALPKFQQAVKLDPDQAQLHNGVGLALVALNRFDDALREFARASALDPAYAWSHYESGDALLKLGRNPEALAQFNEALRIEPENYQILTHIARVLAAIDDPKMRNGPLALTLAQKANDLTGGVQPYILDVLSMADAATGDFVKARTTIQQAIDTAQSAQLPSLPDYQKRLALYEKNQPWVESFRVAQPPHYFEDPP